MGLTIETKKKLAVIFFLLTGVTGTFGTYTIIQPISFRVLK